VVAHASKSAFCAANDALDKASANVTSNAGFLAVLKANASELKILKENAPPGSLGKLVQQSITIADEAVAANNANDLNNLPSGGAIDTYCGVQGDGQPLPKYFNTGSKTTFCKTFIPLFQAVGGATTDQGLLAVLDSHKSVVEQLGVEASSLPSTIVVDAQAALIKVFSAIVENSTNPLNLDGNGPGQDVAMFCGQNQ
jgi:hypothetical protein